MELVVRFPAKGKPKCYYSCIIPCLSDAGCRHFLIDYISVPAFVQHSVMESYIDNSVSFEISDHFPICAKFNMDLYRDIQKRTFLRLKWNQANDVAKRLYLSEIDMYLESKWNINTTHRGINETSNFLVNVLHTCASKIYQLANSIIISNLIGKLNISMICTTKSDAHDEIGCVQVDHEIRHQIFGSDTRTLSRCFVESFEM